MRLQIVCATDTRGNQHATTATYPNTADTLCGLKGLLCTNFFTLRDPWDTHPNCDPGHRKCEACFSLLAPLPPRNPKGET